MGLAPRVLPLWENHSSHEREFAERTHSCSVLKLTLPKRLSHVMRAADVWHHQSAHHAKGVLSVLMRNTIQSVAAIITVPMLQRLFHYVMGAPVHSLQISLSAVCHAHLLVQMRNRIQTLEAQMKELTAQRATSASSRASGHCDE